MKILNRLKRIPGLNLVWKLFKKKQIIRLSPVSLGLPISHVVFQVHLSTLVLKTNLLTSKTRIIPQNVQKKVIHLELIWISVLGMKLCNCMSLLKNNKINKFTNLKQLTVYNSETVEDYRPKDSPNDWVPAVAMHLRLDKIT